MRTICLHDKQEIWEFLKKNTFLHLYAIGDLDDFFWPYTTWYALVDQQRIVQLALLYCASSLPVLLATSEEESSEETRALLKSIVPFLPKRFYTHINHQAAESLAEDYRLESHGIHYQMALMHPDRIGNVDTSRVNALTKADLSDLEALYAASYPGNWFDPRMIETGHYYGVRNESSLISVAGVHVYSAQYGVAALGNITTHPAYRGQQLATQTSAKLCASLLKTVDAIGLNVHGDNHNAIACYSRLGFERVAVYEEFMCNSK
jgi:ribosomal protein S18 acetylase RimI-like enzyme